MTKKYVILSLVLLIGGAASLKWVLTEWEKERHLQQEYHEILKAGQVKLDKLVIGKTDVPLSSDIVISESLQQQLDKYKARKETIELAFTASIVCILSGSSFFAWWLLLRTVRLLIGLFSWLMKIFAVPLRRHRKNTDEKPTEAHTKEPKKELEEKQKQPAQKNARPITRGDRGNTAKHSFRQFEKQSKVLISSGWHGVNKDYHHSPQNSQQNSLWDFREESLGLEDPLKTQTENLERQMAELSAVAKTIQQTSLEHSEPLNNTLAELTEQVSAIREYASWQQERVEKLQEGYDWNIIRTFCLRVIRCIDNVEAHIDRLSKQNIGTTELEETRDELIFALESSGIERFEPEVNSDYGGQEKMTEAVKDKERNTNPKLKGKIAKVVRPGYRYSIDEENVKVVRTAQVQLFG